MVLDDPDDEPLVQLAQESGALVIITDNRPAAQALRGVESRRRRW